MSSQPRTSSPLLCAILGGRSGFNDAPEIATCPNNFTAGPNHITEVDRPPCRDHTIKIVLNLNEVLIPIVLGAPRGLMLAAAVG